MKEGDLVLVLGTNFFEKTKVKERKKGILYLENGIQTDRELKAINSKFQVKAFDQNEYEILESKRIISRGIDELTTFFRKGIVEADKLKFTARKMTKILEKLREN